MEEERQRRECNNKKVMLPRVGGGGPETLILWGGALAVAGLVAAFSFKKRNNSTIVKEENKEKSDGLRFVLHHQSSSQTLSLNPCSVSSEIPPKIGQIDDCTTGSLINMGIMEEKDHTFSGEYQEILLSDDSEKESIVISNDGDGDIDADEDFPVPILENMTPSNMEIEFETVSAQGLMIEQDMTEKTSEESPSSSTEEIQEIEEEMSMESQLIWGKEENHYQTESSLIPASSSSSEEEAVREESEESSTEAKEALIWAAEIIDASTTEHKKAIINYQNTTEIQELLSNKEAVVVVHGGKHLIRWQIALCSVVLPLLLLLLAHWIITPRYSF